MILLRTTDIRVGTEKKMPLKENSSGKKIEAEKRELLKRDMPDARSEKKLTAGVSMIR